MVSNFNLKIFGADSENILSTDGDLYHRYSAHQRNRTGPHSTHARRRHRRPHDTLHFSENSLHFSSRRQEENNTSRTFKHFYAENDSRKTHFEHFPSIATQRNCVYAIKTTMATDPFNCARAIRCWQDKSAAKFIHLRPDPYAVIKRSEFEWSTTPNILHTTYRYFSRPTLVSVWLRRKKITRKKCEDVSQCVSLLTSSPINCGHLFLAFNSSFVEKSKIFYFSLFPTKIRMLFRIRCVSRKSIKNNGPNILRSRAISAPFQSEWLAFWLVKLNKIVYWEWFERTFQNAFPQTTTHTRSYTSMMSESQRK